MKLLNLFLSVALAGFALLSFARASDGPDYDESDLRPGKNVCSYKDSRPVKANVSTTEYTYVSYLKKVKNRWWGETYRTIYRRKSRIVYHMVTQMKDVDVYYCCNGWTSRRGSSECSIPVCGISCMNGGTCVGPDECKCAQGFKGKYCQNDINECTDIDLNECEQVCENTHGSFNCHCRDGYRRDEQNRNACLDINECDLDFCRCPPGDNNCRSNCTNLPGNYQCSCSKGYKTGFDGSCRDYDECNYQPCEHRCANTPGSYQCSCFLGFQLNATSGTCHDIDECKIDNGGCNQVCHNIYGGSICSCKDGYYLDRDMRTCIVIGPTIKTVSLCGTEDYYKMISCIWPSKIKTVFAFYGRVSNDICPVKNFTENSNCIIDGALKHVSELCDDKTACLMDPASTSASLKDSCPNVKKYLQVFYKCA